MWQKKDVVQHFENFAEDDKWSRLYDEQEMTVTSYSFIVRKQRVQELLSPIIQPGMRVLDVGCGPGILLPYFVANKSEYHGVDISQEMIDQAKKRLAHLDNQGVTLSVGDVEKLDYPDGHFDIVVALGLLEYLGDIHTAMNEITRVTKSAGTIVMNVPNRTCPDALAIRHLSNVVTPLYQGVRKLIGKPTQSGNFYHRRFTAQELDEAVQQHGCRKTGDAYYNMEVAFYPFRRMVPKVALWAKQHVERYHRSMLRFLATGYICMCRKTAEE